ncbi:MAG: hypothetical protein J0M17_12460 [Planctomycetes bacterium]|nr:hypothetical protein [Planctomycetota bacterium]
MPAEVLDQLVCLFNDRQLDAEINEILQLQFQAVAIQVRHLKLNGKPIVDGLRIIKPVCYQGQRALENF